MRSIFLLLLAGLLAGCAQVSDFASSLRPAQPAEAEAPVDAEEPEADLAAEEPETEGVAEPVRDAPSETLATLGNAAEPGLWLKTPLVTSQGPGRVTSPETGTSVELTLIPIEAEATAGSRASLAALQALGLPLTAISPLRVEPL